MEWTSNEQQAHASALVNRGRPTPTSGTFPKGDTGLKFLLPLYQFLRNECADAAYLTLVKGFKDCGYMTNSAEWEISIDNMVNMTFFEFLMRVTSTKNSTKKKKTKTELTPEQPERAVHIHNLADNESILKKVRVQDLIEQNNVKCIILKKLDLSLLLTIVSSQHLYYTIDGDALVAVKRIKDIRNRVFHPKYRFSAEDFEKHLKELTSATETLFKYVDASRIPSLRNQEKQYREQGLEHKSGYSILENLQNEIHSKYAPLPTFLQPIISDTMRNTVIEDLPKYVMDCNQGDFKSLPLLLCGLPGMGKSTVLRNLAALAVKSERFALVLYLKDLDRNPKKRTTSNTISSSDFWEQIHNCVKSMAERTVKNYGLEDVAAVIREYKSNILFILDWNMRPLGNLFKEMQHGTWIAAHREVVSRTNDWKVLEIKPLSEYHVLQLLKMHSGGHEDDIVRLYRQCEYKNLISSPDMVEVFWHHGSTINFGTDFELIAAFIDTKLKSSDWILNRKMPEVLKLGEMAFNAIKVGNNNVFNDKKSQIDDEVGNLFLCYENGEIKFRYSSVHEFIAAFYVYRHSVKACREWLANAPSFMKVFKFVCGMWCNSGFWGDRCTISDQAILYMEEYLTNLFDIKNSKKCKESRETEVMEVDCSGSMTERTKDELMEVEGSGRKKQRAKDKPMEVDGSGSKKQGAKDKPKEVEGSGSKKEGAKDKMRKFENPFKNTLSNWEYLVALDDVCQGERKILDLFVRLLSSTRCWVINTEEFEDRKLTRLAILMKKVKLNENFPVSIKLESTTDARMLIKVWNRLKNILNLHNCSNVKIYITRGIGYPYGDQHVLKDLSRTLASAYCPVFITSYRGPLLCSTTLEFLKGYSLRNLDTIDVIVYDVSSLVEILKCDQLPHLKYVSVTVELTNEEQELASLKPFRIPEHHSLKLRIKYFDNIQKFLDMAGSPCNLRSLSIYDVYVNIDFGLNLKEYESMENLSLIFQPFTADQPNSKNPFVDEHFHQNLGQDDMDVEKKFLVDKNYRIPRHSWMFYVTVKVKQPPKLERLLLRNMDFYDDSNNNLLLNILKTSSVEKLIILDSHISLKGVRKVLSSHTSDGDDIQFVTKKLKNNKLEMNDETALMKKPRLSVESRGQKRVSKPKGKEVVITSEMGFCKSCHIFPCLCVSRELERNDNLDDLVNLIKDVYLYDIVSFNYTSKVATIRKDVCEDLRVHCALPGLEDNSACDISSSQSIFHRFFKILALAQSIWLEQTQLTFQGVKDVVDTLRTVKMTSSGSIEPFSLTIVSSYHPFDDEVIPIFMETIKQETMFTTFSFVCSCENKCFRIKKTFNGKMLYNDRLQGE